MASTLAVALGLMAPVTVAYAAAAAPTAPVLPPPTQQGRGIILTEPGVVFVLTSFSVNVRLRYADSRRASGFSTINGHYSTSYASGSGFVVNPNGVVVTASHVVEPATSDVRKFATNELIGRVFGYPDLRNKPFSSWRINDNRILNGLLLQCYRGVACSFHVTPSYQIYSGVQIAGVSAPRGAPARLLKSTGFKNTDIAVLQTDALNLATVALGRTASTLQTGDDLAAIGFPGSAQKLPTGLTQPSKAFGKVSTVRDTGTSKQIQVDIRAENGMSGGPVLDNSGEVVGLVSYTLLSQSGSATQAYVRSVDDIRATLAQAGVTASRGRGDRDFVQAMNLYWGRHYSAALPLFQRVLNIQDGQPLAKQYQATAQQKANTAQDIPVKKPSSSSGWPLDVGIGAAVLLVIGGVAFLVIRNRPGQPQPATANDLPQPGLPAQLPLMQGEPPTAPIERAADRDGSEDLTAIPSQRNGAEPPPVIVLPDAAREPVAAVPPAAEPPADADGHAADGHQMAAQAPARHAAVAAAEVPTACAVCGNAVPQGNRFCGGCGTPLAP